MVVTRIPGGEMKLTKAIIENAIYPLDHTGSLIHWDDDILGFGLKVYPSGKKSFVLSYRLHRRKHQFTIGLYGRLTLEQARNEAKIKFGQIAQGINPIADRKKLRNQGTVKELCEIYLERHAKVHKKTWREDQRMILNRIVPTLGTVAVKSLTPADAMRLHQKIGESSKYVANRTLEVLRTAVEKGKDWGLLEQNAPNPVSRLQWFKETKRDRWLTPEELPRVARSIALEENIYVRAAIWLYLLTGVRKSELLTAKWENVDLIRRELRLEDTKNGLTHYVPLSSAAVEIVKTIPRLHGNPFLIPGLKAGGHLVGISRPWNRIRTRAGVQDCRIHDLRRTLGSWLAQNGASLHLIGRVLNHSSNEATRVYARFSQDTVRDALEAHGTQVLALQGRA